MTDPLTPDTPNSLFEQTRRHVEKAMQDVTGDEDFLPLMVVRDHADRLIGIGLMMPDVDAARDVLAHTMSALCMLHRATEVAFTSATWMVKRRGKQRPDLRPSECDDRQEVAIITMINVDGSTVMHAAPIIRENNLAGVGMWSQLGNPAEYMDHFVDAIRVGVAMGQKVPPEIGAFMDSQIGTEGENTIIQTMTKQFAEVSERQRKGVQN